MTAFDGDQGLHWVQGRRCMFGNCVEVARMRDGRVAVRSSRDSGRPPAVLDADEWADFLVNVRGGDFNQV